MNCIEFYDKKRYAPEYFDKTNENEDSTTIPSFNWNPNKKSHAENVPEAIIFNGDAEPIGTNSNSTFVKRSLHSLEN